MPGEVYPEFKGKVAASYEENIVYKLFRRLMLDLQFEARNFSTPIWNPLGEIIQPGQNVLIKPNLVRHIHLGGGNYQAVVTHGSIIRCVLDYVALALKGSGEITVGDAPVQSTDFDEGVQKLGLKEICEDVSKCWGVPVRLVDFRLWSVKLDEKHRVVSGRQRGGDPKGYVAVDLGKKSLLHGLQDFYRKFRVTNYDCGEMVIHHNLEVHEYFIPRSVLDADVVINLPKLKTHRKVGLTCALKNMVGINGHKDWLPHHRVGSASEGGDEYLNPSSLKRLQAIIGEGLGRDPHSRCNPLRRFGIRAVGKLTRYIAKDSYEEGSWYGNDTLWRTVLDLNRLLVYAKKDGRMMDYPQRRCFTIVDGIVAGEGEGPMEPSPRSCGILAAGMNPVAVDAVLATMVGFDYAKIPLIANAFRIGEWPLIGFGANEIEVRSEDSRWKSLRIGEPCMELCFSPPAGWARHVEFEQCFKRQVFG